MENKQKLQKLLIAQEEEFKKVLALSFPDFYMVREWKKCIKENPDLDDSQSLVTIMNYGESVSSSLKNAYTDAIKGWKAVQEALILVPK
jgi:hypothetical protein